MSEKRGMRWWPVAVLLLLAAIALARIWTGEAPQRQARVESSYRATFLLLVGLSIWLLAFSRLRARVRLTAFAAAILAVVLAVASLEIREVSGDVVPVLAWRWSAPPDAHLPTDLKEAAALPDETAVKQESAGDSAGSVPGAADFPQFMGPHRNGKVDAVRLARDWSTEPPRPLWRRPIGAGWSGFAVAGSVAVTSEQRGASEMVVAYDLRRGRVLWSHTDQARFASVVAGDGPRATPAIAGGRVLALGATGILNSLDLATGERLWSVNIVDDSNARIPEYGVCASPLVVNGVVVVLAGGGAGGSLVAYDAASGARLWSGGSDPAAYSSPISAELAGRRQFLVFNSSRLVGQSMDTGEVLWGVDWPSGTERTSQPVVLAGDRVFLSSGYGVGGKLFHITAGAHQSLSGIETQLDGETFAAELLWESLGLKAKFTNVVERDGFLYGLDDGILVCLDAADGSRRWKRGRYGHGQILLAGDLLLVQTERGEVVLVEASPEAHVELGRFTAIEGKSWNHPALAGPYLLVRNGREAACYQLPTL